MGEGVIIWAWDDDEEEYIQVQANEDGELVIVAG
jgi:hypothetical protein